PRCTDGATGGRTPILKACKPSERSSATARRVARNGAEQKFLLVLGLAGKGWHAATEQNVIVAVNARCSTPTVVARLHRHDQQHKLLSPSPSRCRLSSLVVFT
ncbi:unnamed protein product, partial [Ectocarpus sp. 13 AM-2016]